MCFRVGFGGWVSVSVWLRTEGFGWLAARAAVSHAYVVRLQAKARLMRRRDPWGILDSPSVFEDVHPSRNMKKYIHVSIHPTNGWNDGADEMMEWMDGQMDGWMRWNEWNRVYGWNG